MKKEDIDLANAMSGYRILRCERRSGGALTESQSKHSIIRSTAGPGSVPVSQRRQPIRLSGQLQEGLGYHASEGGHAVFPDLRS